MCNSEAELIKESMNAAVAKAKECIALEEGEQSFKIDDIDLGDILQASDL